MFCLRSVITLAVANRQIELLWKENNKGDPVTPAKLIKTNRLNFKKEFVKIMNVVDSVT